MDQVLTSPFYGEDEVKLTVTTKTISSLSHPVSMEINNNIAFVATLSGYKDILITPYLDILEFTKWIPVPQKVPFRGN